MPACFFSTSPFPGMATRVRLLQVDDRQPGVVLERFQVFMAEEVFDVPEIGAAADQFRRARPPKRVSRDHHWQPGILDQLHELSTEDVVRQPVSVAPKPDRPFRGVTQLHYASQEHLGAFLRDGGGRIIHGFPRDDDARPSGQKPSRSSF